jgi:ACT domain-containing protein
MKQVVLQKEKTINTIENPKELISIEKAVKVFSISRASYHNYKTLVTTNLMLIIFCSASSFIRTNY